MDVNSMQRQQGLTFVSWALSLVVVAFLVFAAVRIIPVYITEFEVSSSLNTLAEDHEMARAPKHAIRRKLQKLLNVNSIDHPSSRDADISVREGGARMVRVPYEVRVPFTAQVAVVFSFSPSAEIAPQ